MIMLAVGEVEDSIFKKRKDDDVIFLLNFFSLFSSVALLLDCDAPLAE